MAQTFTLGTPCSLTTMSLNNKLRALAGLPVPMSDFSCLVYPKTLRDLATIGINEFFGHLNFLTLTEADIRQMTGEDISPFDFLLKSATIRENFKDRLEQSILYFTGEKILLIPEMDAISLGDFAEQRMLTDDNFFEFQEILRQQNFLEEQKVRHTGENEAAQLIRKRLEDAQKKVEIAKGKKEESPIELSDLIGSLCIKTSIDITKVWDITYYAFNDQFKRLRFIEEHETGLQSIMAGADPKKIKLKDWIRSVQQK